MRQTKSIYDAPMKRITVRIPAELEREVRGDIRPGETVAKWVRDAVKQRLVRQPTTTERGFRRSSGTAPAPPKRVQGQAPKRISVRIPAWHVREIRRHHLMPGETVAKWVRDAIRESVVRARAAKIVARHRGPRTSAVKKALRVLDSPSPLRCR